MPAATHPLAGIDLAGRRFIEYVQGVATLTWHILTGMFRRPVYAREYIVQINEMGVSSLPVIGLTGIVTGLVLALQSYLSLAQFGGTALLGNAITGTLVRELGPILGGLMMAGRVGAGITSQIGAMRVTSQIDALMALGTDPIKKLVIPRVVALIITLPVVITILCFLGIVGAWALARFQLQYQTGYFWGSVLENLRFIDIFSSLSKAAVYGYLISIIACYEGLRTQGGTHGVGQATTRAVVLSSLLIIISNFFLSKFFYTVVHSL
jgi:phospholipid/cholesterol/gamma-HCH transport system permease protein